MKRRLIRHLGLAAKSQAAKTIAPQLGVTEDIIEATKDAINADGIFNVARGKGGGLSVSGGLQNEKSIYPVIKPHLEQWISSSIFGNHGVTHHRLNPTHSRKLSGKWSTPDFSLLCAHKFIHAPHKSIELATVEVKHAPTQFDVSCVYEALAHTRVSSYSILFFYDDPIFNFVQRGQKAVFEEIKFECSRLGIGLIVSEYPCDLDMWQYVIPAKKHDPDLRRVDGFVEEAFDDYDKKWLKQQL